MVYVKSVVLRVVNSSVYAGRSSILKSVQSYGPSKDTRRPTTSLVSFPCFVTADKVAVDLGGSLPPPGFVVNFFFRIFFICLIYMFYITVSPFGNEIGRASCRERV